MGLKKKPQKSKIIQERIEEFEGIKRKILSIEDQQLINEFINTLERPHNISLIKLETKKETLFKKKDKEPLKYKPIENSLKLFCKMIKKKRVDAKTLMTGCNTFTVHKILYHYETVKETTGNNKIVSIPFSTSLIEKILEPSNNVHTYLIQFDYYSKDEQFIDSYKKFKENKKKDDFQEDAYFNEYTEEKGKITTTCCDKDVDYSSNNLKGKLSLNINGKKNHIIFTLIIFGDNDKDNDKGIIVDFFTTSEYKDYIQRTNKDTRFFSWYKNDPYLFLKNLLILIKNTNEFNENFDFYLNHHVFDLDESLKTKIINNSLTLKDLFYIIYNSKEDDIIVKYNLFMNDLLNSSQSHNNLNNVGTCTNPSFPNIDSSNNSFSTDYNPLNLPLDPINLVQLNDSQRQNNNNDFTNILNPTYTLGKNAPLTENNRNLFLNSNNSSFIPIPIPPISENISQNIPQNIPQINSGSYDLQYTSQNILSDTIASASTSNNNSPLTSINQSPLCQSQLSLDITLTPNNQLSLNNPEILNNNIQNSINSISSSNNNSPYQSLLDNPINSSESFINQVLFNFINSPPLSMQNQFHNIDQIINSLDINRLRSFCKYLWEENKNLHNQY
ncbi:hypothetical protein PIROE2DRAFT_62959 [Piromyces sp. E2]|nr:hypothetical protein PIROE2DRAFT_62959 [Piromyces sp. E2]|eukprot:OUM60747.1 hypothetical protein PIROE2DRAFT_62959 [Piromyces sp. E2]